MRRFVFIVLSLIPPAVALAGGCGFFDPFHTTFDDVEPAETYAAARPQPVEPPGDAIRVATYNVKFAGARVEFFWECPGDRVNLSESEVETNLSNLADAIERIDADVLLLQEVDVVSKRVAYIDQVEWLVEHTDYNHGVYASQWKSDYIPSDGVGRTNSGNVILSKWPIEDAKRIALPLIEQQGGLEQYFWLRRNILEARIDVPGGPKVRAMGIHTAAFAEDDTTRLQIEKLAERMEKHAAAGELVVAGGDLNTIPPGSDKYKDFYNDRPSDCELEGDDYSSHDGWTDPLYDNFTPAVSLEDFEADNAPYDTFTGRADGFWNRKLDYLFTNGEFVEGSALTYQSEERGGVETMPLSDHAPLAVELRLTEPSDSGGEE